MEGVGGEGGEAERPRARCVCDGAECARRRNPRRLFVCALACAGVFWGASGSGVDVDADGKALPSTTTFALCGQVRAMGESDDSINRLATKAGRK